ncbi:Oidioi.mRNA.OKI2018_I69.chr1.g766.t1.cds [Oikopleura dioica]|uniref:Oidioi.mRNA.OKI2018_I69.chr1.g766.t1.cds n=1 Tax=Oikopleura dioica TaxID=34765 RepID=A0ABN7SLD9_OIKDI|nr:Oidioi.mRNA.OKI2018_I69.chr1.g766.t1.cds [Oikopleura dioica]
MAIIKISVPKSEASVITFSPSLYNITTPSPKNFSLKNPITTTSTTTISPVITESYIPKPDDFTILLYRHRFIFFGDKKIKKTSATQAHIFPPYAVIKDQLFLFGNDQIAMLDGCSVKKMKIKTLNSYNSGSAALSIEGNSKALICFDSYYGNKSGGKYYRRESKDVWILKNNDWSIIGHLKSRLHTASSIQIQQFVFIVDNALSQMEVARLKIEDDKIVESEVVGHYSFETRLYERPPVLYQTKMINCI